MCWFYINLVVVLTDLDMVSLCAIAMPTLFTEVSTFSTRGLTPTPTTLALYFKHFHDQRPLLPILSWEQSSGYIAASLYILLLYCCTVDIWRCVTVWTTTKWNILRQRRTVPVHVLPNFQGTVTSLPAFVVFTPFQLCITSFFRVCSIRVELAQIWPALCWFSGSFTSRLKAQCYSQQGSPT